LTELILIIYLAFQNIQPHYDMWTGKIFCDTPRDCFHEEAHKMDAEQGWISKSDDYKSAVDTFRSVAWICIECRDEYSEMVMFFPGVGRELQPEHNPLNYGFWHGGWGGMQELYAEIYAMAEGNPENMPEIFRPFYDFKTDDEIYKNTPKTEIRTYIFNSLACVGESRY
jgi:hypothetical protein